MNSLLLLFHSVNHIQLYNTFDYCYFSFLFECLSFHQQLLSCLNNFLEFFFITNLIVINFNFLKIKMPVCWLHHILILFSLDIKSRFTVLFWHFKSIHFSFLLLLSTSYHKLGDLKWVKSINSQLYMSKVKLPCHYVTRLTKMSSGLHSFLEAAEKKPFCLLFHLPCFLAHLVPCPPS